MIFLMHVALRGLAKEKSSDRVCAEMNIKTFRKLVAGTDI